MNKKKSDKIILSIHFLAIAVFPFIMAILFSTGGEAFLGNKEPIFEMIIGFAFGLALSLTFGVIGIILFLVKKASFIFPFTILMIFFDCLAIPLGRCFIKGAQASPTDKIEKINLNLNL